MSSSNDFHRIDGTRITLHEHLADAPRSRAIYVFLAKYLKLKLFNYSSDDPTVPSLEPYEVSQDSLPPDVGPRLRSMIAEFSNLGFENPIFHSLDDTFHWTRTYLVTMRHRGGRAIGRIHHRVWTKPRVPKVYLFAEFMTCYADGTILWSTAAKPDFDAPPSMRINRLRDVTATNLWESHQLQMARDTQAGKDVLLIGGELEQREAENMHHRAVFDFHVKRGVFVPRTESEQQEAQFIREMQDSAATTGFTHTPVLVEIERLQNKKASWSNILLLLVISLLLFVGAGRSYRDWEFVALLIPILFFHEMGHYLMMRVFGYRNLRMFFIPFLGAAVSGRHYNVPGWKKAIVSLMGPVPGIIVGIGLGIAWMINGHPLLMKASVIMLILNGSNLLPILPLDGGWVMHTIIFSRHFVLNGVFRVIAALLLLGAAALGGGRALMAIGIALILGLPSAYKIARIADQLRKSGFVPASPDSQRIPIPSAQVIIDKVKLAFSKNVTTKMIAQHSLDVFELLNARPPGVLASLGLTAIHAGGLVLSLAFLLVIVVERQGGFRNVLASAQLRNQLAMARRAAQPPKYTVDPDDMPFWNGTGSASPVGPGNTIVTTFEPRTRARQLFDQIKSNSAAGVGLRLFGSSLLVALPGEDASVREQWFNQLQSAGKDTFVDTPATRACLTLMCQATDEAAAKAVSGRISEFFAIPEKMFAIAPWMSDDSRTPEQRHHDDVARATFIKAQRVGFEFFRDPTWTDLMKQHAAARRRGDAAEARRLEDQQKQYTDQARQRDLEALRKAADGTVDLAVLEDFLSLEASRKEKDYRDRLARLLGPRLGQLPLHDGKPAPGADRQWAHGGYASNQGNAVHVSVLAFIDVSNGAPALVKWLGLQNCRDFHYQFAASEFGDGERDNDLE